MKSSPEFDEQTARTNASMGWGYCEPPHEVILSEMGNEVVDTDGNIGEFVMGVCRVAGIKYDVRMVNGIWRVELKAPERHDKDGRLLTAITVVRYGLSEGKGFERSHPLRDALASMITRLAWKR